jgi:hypothetical protein
MRHQFIDFAPFQVKPLTESSNFTNVTEAVRKLVSGKEDRKSLEAYISDGDMSGKTIKRVLDQS